MLHHAQSKTTILHHSDRIIVTGIQLAQESRIYMDYSVIHNHCSFHSIHINNILKITTLYQMSVQQIQICSLAPNMLCMLLVIVYPASNMKFDDYVG